MPNGLVSAAQFPGLVSDVPGSISRGLALGGQVQQLQAQRRQAEQEAQVRGLTGRVLGGDRQAQQQLGAVSPQALQQTLQAQRQQFENQDIERQNEIRGAVRTATQIQATPSVEGKLQLLQKERQRLVDAGSDSSTVDNIIGMLQRGDTTTANNVIDGVVNVGEKFGIVQPTVAERAASKAEKGAPKVKSSNFVEGGGAEVVMDDGTIKFIQPTPEEVALIRAGEERGVDLQQRRAKGRGIGAGTAKLATNALDLTEKMRSNNLKLRKVIAEVRGGAETGPLANRLPSFRASTLRLMQIKNELGLDVVGSVTFGALSEGELNLAMDTALPTALEGPELVRWAQDKIAAQEKLAEYFEDQAIFLSKQGNTAADWLELGRARRGEQEVQPVAAQPITAPAAQPSQVGRFTIEVVQ